MVMSKRYNTRMSEIYTEMVAVWTQMMQICSLSSCTVKDDSYCILDKQIKYCESEKEKIWLKKFGPSLESLASCTDILNAHNMKLRRRGNMNNVQCTAHANTKKQQKQHAYPLSPQAMDSDRAQNSLRVTALRWTREYNDPFS